MCMKNNNQSLYLHCPTYMNRFFKTIFILFLQLYKKLYFYLSSTFNTIPRVKRTSDVIFYWSIDIVMTNQHSCILHDVP